MFSKKKKKSFSNPNFKEKCAKRNFAIKWEKIRDTAFLHYIIFLIATLLIVMPYNLHEKSQ